MTDFELRNFTDLIAMMSEIAAARGTRQYGRVDLHGDVRVSHESGSTVARACDLGCGGMSFFTALQLAEGDIVHLEFGVPHSGMAFRVKAEVKNRNGLRYGVQFHDLSPDEFGEIARVTAILSFSQA